jgi:regulatory protein
LAYPLKRKRESRKREAKEDSEAAKQLAFRFLSYRPRSTEELRSKLLEAGFSPAAVEKALGRIRDLGYLNDYEHALTFGRSCIEHKLWGVSRIRDALSNKGIPAGIIASALRTLEQEHDFTRVARRALQSRFSPAERTMAAGGKARQKAIAFLLRRGFSWDTIANVIDSAPDPCS